MQFPGAISLRGEEAALEVFTEKAPKSAADQEASEGRIEIYHPCQIPIAPPWVDSSKGPPRKIGKKIGIFWIFPAHAKNGLGWPQMGPGGFFPTNPDLADILGRTDFDFENLYFFNLFGSQLGPGLGPALGPGLGPGVGPAWARAFGGHI